MDNNYKKGLVFSDGQVIGEQTYAAIQTFPKRKKHTYALVTSIVNHELKQIDWSKIKTLFIENLKHVKSNERGTFSRQFNRRLLHWLYGQIRMRLAQACEERGVRLVLKNPAYTSQTCSECGWCERRNRNGDRFKCLRCGHECQADYNASKNLETLGLAEVYGLRSLPNFQ